MLQTPPESRFVPGTRVRVTHSVRVGDRRWQTQVEGVVELEGTRPVGGMEMGGKASYCLQPTIRLKRDDGETTVVALDGGTRVEEVSAAASPTVDATRTPASSDASWLAAGAVIVVHGVGNQERGATLTTLMQAIGNLAPGGTGNEVVAQGDVLVKPSDEPDMPLGSPRARGECISAYCPHAELRWSDGKTCRSLPCYEFYWANESRVGDSIWNQARSYWQILAGLPRLGLYAMDGPAGSRPRLVDSAARFFYTVAWATLVPRLLLGMLMGGCRLRGYSTAFIALYYPFAWVDVIRTWADVLFILTLAVWWLWTPRRDREILGQVATTALLALTAGTILSDLVPLGIRFDPFKHFELLLRFIRGEFIPPPEHFDPGSYDPRSLYVFNTVTGLLWMLGYALILLGIVCASLSSFAAWLRRRLQGPRPGGADHTIDAQTRVATGWWLGVGFVVLVLHPLAFIHDWSLKERDRASWTLLTFHFIPEDMYDLRLISWKDGRGVTTSGKSLVIVGPDNDRLLHIRIFNADGDLVTDTDEKKLLTQQGAATTERKKQQDAEISALKKQVAILLTRRALSNDEKAQILTEATSLVGQNPAVNVDKLDIYIYHISNQIYRIFEFILNLIIVPISLVSFLLLTSSHVRQMLTPILELALDVLNYLPPRRFIDSWSVSRFLLGGRRSTRRPRLDEVLDARLRTLIALAAERHGEPVRLVAHSLGAIIALSAVDNWPGPGRIVDLTTMGNPLMLLAERFPYIYGRARSDGGHRNTPAVRRWRNYYYNQDLIGRSLDRQLTVPAGASHVKFEPDLSLGDGTHTDYFGDPRFAARVLSV